MHRPDQFHIDRCPSPARDYLLMLESKLHRIQELALEAQDDLERRFLESAMRLLVEIENLTRPDNARS